MKGIMRVLLPLQLQLLVLVLFKVLTDGSASMCFLGITCIFAFKAFDGGSGRKASLFRSIVRRPIYGNYHIVADVSGFGGL